MSEQRKIRVWAVCYGTLLALFTLFVLLDTFVIERRLLDAGMSGAQKDVVMAAQAPRVTLASYRVNNSDVHVAEIVLTDASQLKTALAQDTYGRNISALTSETARVKGALLAVNGDYYGSRNAGYVVRNGVLFRERSAGFDQEDLVIDASGAFTLIREGDVSANELVELGAAQVFSFGPGLVENGEIIVDEREEVGQAMVSNPRTAIAMIAPLHYLFVVSDGRTQDSEGLTLYQLATFLREMGATIAYNLDGGGSSTMVYEGEIVNYPTTRGRFSEREVSDIVYIK